MKSWKSGDAPVLAVWGASDFQRRHGARVARRRVNSWRPGTAKYVKLDGLDHWLFKAADQRASMDREGKNGEGEYDDRIAELLATFMTEHSK